MRSTQIMKEAASKLKTGSTITQVTKPPVKMQVAAASLDTRTHQLEQVIDNMHLSHGTGLLLAGATGIGKTTFVKQLGRLMGMPVVLVEAPHITEEHLINIPFIVFDPVTRTGHAHSMNVSPQDYHVQLGESYLASELAKKRMLPDAQLINMIKASDQNIRKLWENMGGDETQVPPEVAQVRENYRVILFLDEYFRQTSANVRNILRGILNGRIGNDRVPPGTYVIYASNLTDVGHTIEEIPLNADFKKITYAPPTKAEFLHYLVSRFESDTKVQLKPEVIEAFDQALTDEHISYDDATTEIRTSPRRWEQIMLYVNASVPVQSESEASALLANVKAQFQQADQISSLLKITEAAVRKILAQTSGEHMADVKSLSAADWRRTLQHQIETKIKLGDARSYVPVIAGMPGIGKTAQAADIAQKMNMLLIPIDCSTLTVDEITGIPVPQTDGHKMNVQFSEPSLYQKIQNDIKKDTAAYMADPGVPAEKKKAFDSQPYKYLIFFDELNRVKTANIFNSLRRVILEKSFNDQVHLPAESIVIAAMNPHDKGTVELTGHLKDATDYIDTDPSWSQTSKFIERELQTNPKLSRYSDQAKSMAWELVQGFANTFPYRKGTKDLPEDTRKFYIRLGDDKIYMSPREYSTMTQDLVAGLNRVVRKAARMEPDEYQQALFEAAWVGLEKTLSWILDKHQTDSPQFLNEVKEKWLRPFSASFMIKTRSAAELAEMLDIVLADPTKHLKDDVDFVNYVNNFQLNKFTEDFENYLRKLFANARKPADPILTGTHPKKVIKDGQVQVQPDLVSQIEYVVNELRQAAQVHDLSADLLTTMEDGVTSALGELGTQDMSDDDFNEILEKVHEIFSNK